MIRIASVIVVRNEETLIATTIRHLLRTVNVDRIFIADNGSTDRTQHLLAAISKRDSRVSWSSWPGYFDQSKITTELAHQALKDGCDWVFAFDADEFLWVSSETLRAVCSFTDAGALRVQRRNFVQLRPGKQDHLASLMSMVFSANPQSAPEGRRAAVVSGRLAFIEAGCSPKLIIRLVPGLVIHKGNHGADNLNGPIRDFRSAEILHAPLHSFTRLEAKSRYAKERTSFSGDESWHLRRWDSIAQSGLREEWRRNSTILGKLPGSPQKLIFDIRLLSIGLRALPFALKTRMRA